MKNKNVSETLGKVWGLIWKNKYVVAVLLVGLFLILLPTSPQDTGKNAEDIPESKMDFSLGEQEKRISEALSEIDGAGRVTVVLTLKSGMEQVLAKDESEATSSGGKSELPETSMEKSSNVVIISAGGSAESPITLKYIYPEYLGALVVSEGADNPAVKLQLVQAVSGLTGLGTDKIIVTKMNKS